MNYKVLKNLVVLFILLISLGCNRYHLRVDYPGDSNKYQKDFLYIVKAIEQLHPGKLEKPLPFDQISDWNLNVDSIYSQLANTEDEIEFSLITSAFLSKLDDSHTSFLFDMSNTMYLPFEFGWVDNDLHIIAVYDTLLNHFLYKKIIKINGKTTKELITLADNHTSGDNNFWKHRIGSMSLIFLRWQPFYIFNRIYKKDNENILFEIDGIDSTISVGFSLNNPATNVLQLENLCRNNISRITKNLNRMSIIKEQSTIYVQLSDINKEVDSAFINSIFLTASAENAKNIILDLRANSGGNSMWCDTFFAHVSKKDDTIPIYKSWRRMGDENILHKGSVKGHFIGHKNPIFNGSLFILTSGRTLSSATFFVVAAQQSKLATVIGTPCGNNSFRYGYISPRIELPETGFNLLFSLGIWERNTDPARTAIMPDILVEPTIDDLRNNTDHILDKALELCNKSSKGIIE